MFSLNNQQQGLPFLCLFLLAGFSTVHAFYGFRSVRPTNSFGIAKQHYYKNHYFNNINQKKHLISLQVYTPEQEQDDKQRQEEEEKAAASATVSDDILVSVQDKLAKSSNDDTKVGKKKDNKAMAFLKKIGKVGGAANKSFVNAVGSDEGSTGRQPAAQRDGGGGGGAGSGVPKKAIRAYKECTVTGIIDDMSESFPLTSSGTEWRGISDRVMGGMSDGFIQRKEDILGKTANILTGHVSLANGGGFIQMVTDLPLDPTKSAVDASDYDGIELTVLCRYTPNQFNVHLRTPGTFQQASHRYTVKLDNSNNDPSWETVRIPFSSFVLHGADNLPPTLNYSALRRIGIVAIGQEMDVSLAVSDVRFYCVI